MLFLYFFHAELTPGFAEFEAWEGSNGWIRQQLEVYLTSLLRTVFDGDKDEDFVTVEIPQEGASGNNLTLGDEAKDNKEEEDEEEEEERRRHQEGAAARMVDDFHLPWIAAWRNTRNYGLWRAAVNEQVLLAQFSPGHPSHLEGGLQDVRTEVLRYCFLILFFFLLL